MPINPDLLIAAPMLQDYLVDKDTGFPLAGGLVTMYRDDARTTYKNWYYQTGAPGHYEYIALDNPLTLSSVGTIADPNGNDVIPFYYPYDEDNENNPQAYYVTVDSVDSEGLPAVRQFTRENFPFLPSNPSPGVGVPTLRNYIVNNVFWRNDFTAAPLDASDILDIVLAPDQHASYSMPDFRFIKNIAGATDSIQFLPMTETLDDDITPEYYCHFECTGAGSGETTKCFQYPITLHVETLANQAYTLAIHAQNPTGSANNFIDIYIYQFLGTGAIAQPEPIFQDRIVLNSAFKKYTISKIFPDTTGLVLGEGGDDALYLQIQMPVDATCNINWTKPQLYLSTDIPDNNFDTYDQIDSVVNTPRTGDYKISLNTICPYGYVPCNDGSIGSADSAATTRSNSDTWPLYNLLWSSVPDEWAPVTGGRGSTAIDDFTGDKPLALTKQLGRTILGANGFTPISNAYVNTTIPIGSNFTIESANVITLTAATDIDFFFTGQPIYVYEGTAGVLPTGLVNDTVYYVGNITGATLQLFTTLEDAIANTSPVSITDDDTAPNLIQSAIGGTSGASSTTLVANNLPEHTHPASSGFFALIDSGSDWPIGAGTTQAKSLITGNNTTTNTPVSVLQASTFVNMFLKL